MTTYSTQMSFPGLDPVQDAVDVLALAEAEERGAIFTRREVVAFILGLMGYTPDAPLSSRRILEPSFGAGEFLFVIVERLFSTLKKDVRSLDKLKSCVRAVELHKDTFAKTRERLREQMCGYGLDDRDVGCLLDAWLIQGDFLFEPFPFEFDFIAGNPPYVRQESIPDVLLREYRKRFVTLYDRADLSVPFIEKSLKHLTPKGTLGFICSDRWVKNRYGGPLRKLVSEAFHLKYYVDMVDTPAFSSEVTAYPAITVIVIEACNACVSELYGLAGEERGNYVWCREEECRGNGRLFYAKRSNQFEAFCHCICRAYCDRGCVVNGVSAKKRGIGFRADSSFQR